MTVITVWGLSLLCQTIIKSVWEGVFFSFFLSWYFGKEIGEESLVLSKDQRTVLCLVPHW